MKQLKTITTHFGDEITLTGDEWFVVMTDKFLSGWGVVTNRTAKRIYVCKNHAEAETFADRCYSNREKYGLRYISATPRIPYYSPSKYVVVIEKYSDNLFRY